MHSFSRASAGAALLLALGSSQAAAVDWSSVSPKTVTLFYPGQASWEWVLTPSDHSGAQRFREGKNCKQCHSGEEREMGQRIVTGQKLEPRPIAGKRGSIPVDVRFARDAERLFVRLEWPEAQPSEAPRMNPAAAKVTMMLSDATVVEATRAGCWSVCHDDAADMASAAPGSTRHKYLPKSRQALSRSGGGDALKPAQELERLAASGMFLEYWQARLAHNAPAVTADGYIFADHEEKVVGPLASAEANFENGRWIVVLSRKLAVGSPTHKDIVPGKVFNVGFAIHDDYADHRFHHVSLEHTLSLDPGAADFVPAAQ
ncbi:MAG: cytochrome c-552 precursor [Rhodospirillales bacterium]|nr:cytochrome c-552 precursor [Rhodospirillales bacterium]